MNFIVCNILFLIIEDKRIKRQTGKETILFVIPLSLLSVKHAQFVRMVMSDLLVAPLLMKDVLSSAITMPGALSVMISGVPLMLMLSVDNLAIRIKVRITLSCHVTSVYSLH